MDGHNASADALRLTYTQDDFLHGVEPFEMVYALRSDAFVQSQVLELVTQYAASVGVRNFKSLYGSYVKSKLQKRANYYVNATNFANQPVELDCGEWTCDEGGVRRGFGLSEEVACPHPILPVERVVSVDTGAEKVRIAFSRGKRWRELIVERNTLASPREIIKLANCGISVNSRTAPVLSDYFMDLETLNYDRLPERRSVGRLGWIDEEGFSPYVADLLFDGDVNYRAMFNAIRSCGDYEAWKAAARDFRAESVAARIILAASFASVLVKPLGTLPFFVHLWGIDSSTGKTVALLVAASVWASPEMGKYVKTFDGTDVGYERTADFLNSLPMCIDELQLAKNRRGETVFNVYKLAQGAGRSRGNRGGGIDRTPVWGNAILTTGESPLTGFASGAGAINRVIDVECTSESKVVRDGRATLQAFKRNYGFAGRDFVERLTAGGLARAESLYGDYFRQLNGDETTDKQAVAAALLVTADQLATEWIFRDGAALTVPEIARFLATKSAVSTGARGYEYMCDWVAQNANRFNPYSEQGDIYGTLENGGDRVYIINSVFRSVCEAAGFSAQALVSYLKSNGLLQLSGTGKTTVTKRLRNTVTRCYCMTLCSESFDDFED